MIVRAHRIEPGSEIQFESAGEIIRVLVPDKNPQIGKARSDIATRLSWFGKATELQKERNQAILKRLKYTKSTKGWTRDELYAERVDRQ